MEWKQWLFDHMQSCETCAQAFNEMNGAMCEAAFAKMRELWQRHRDDQDEGNKDSPGCQI